jgi:hypothetical protein
VNEIILTFVVKITEVPGKSTHGKKKLLDYHYHDQPFTKMNNNKTFRMMTITRFFGIVHRVDE